MLFGLFSLISGPVLMSDVIETYQAPPPTAAGGEGGAANVTTLENCGFDSSEI